MYKNVQENKVKNDIAYIEIKFKTNGWIKMKSSQNLKIKLFSTFQILYSLQ